MTKDKYSYGYAKEKYKSFKLAEEKYNLLLKSKSYYVIRFDGKQMTSTFKHKGQAIYEPFFRVMKKTFYEFCEANKNVILAFSFSDEISVLIKGTYTPKGKIVEDQNRIEKLLSLMSGQLAVMFYKNACNERLDISNCSCIFDARILEIKKIDIFDYFCARQAYAIDKYLTQTKGEYHINFKLYRSYDIISELGKLGVDYYSFPLEYRYGLIYVKKKVIEPFDFSEAKEKFEQLYS